MAANKPFGPSWRKSGEKMGDIMRSVWQRPLLLGLPLLVLAGFLSHLLLKEAFKPYTTCDYLIVHRLQMDVFFCNGYTVQAFGATIFTLPGLKSVMDQPLEQFRSMLAWSTVLGLALFSLFLTILIENFQFVVQLVRFNPAAWKKFLASAQIWLLLFVVFSGVVFVVAK